MRVAILSTDTLHHRYFINQLAKDFDVKLVVFQDQSIGSGDPWYLDMRNYEKRFFGDVSAPHDYPFIVYATLIDDINDTYIKWLLAENRDIDISVVFGTGKLQPHIFTAPRWGCINVHRGISQHYRGLDSELWAIYRGDIQNVGVTIHYIDEQLDTGDILAQKRVVCGKHIELFQLRAVQTVIALHLVRQVLKRFEEKGGPIEGKPQGKGQYYGAMSLADKFHTLERYNRRLEGKS